MTPEQATDIISMLRYIQFGVYFLIGHTIVNMFKKSK